MHPTNIRCTLGICCLLISCNTFAKNSSFSEIDIGFEHITYKESLDDVAGQGQLRQSISVTNPSAHNLSYSGINEKWGFYLEGTTTLATQLNTEHWSIGSFGEIQQNEFRVKASDIGLKAAYNLTNSWQVLTGARFSASAYTRSNFTKVQPGAERFEEAIAPSTFETFQGAISEDQYALLFTLGTRYDSRWAKPSSKWSWYAEADINTPIYAAVQNTAYPNQTLSDSFHGWGLAGKCGIRYKALDHLSIKLGLYAQTQYRDAVVVHTDSGLRTRVPDIELINVGTGLGISWTY